MIAKTLFPHLSEESIMYRYKAIEYFHSSKKVFTTVNMYDEEKRKSIAAGFLFTGVEEMNQKLKTDNVLREFGLEGNPMFEFIFCSDSDKELKTYIVAIGVAVLIIKAKKVELITEGIYYMG